MHGQGDDRGPVVSCNYAPNGFTADATVLLIAVQAVAGHIHDRHRAKARAIFASDDPAAAARAEETADDR